MTTNYSLFYEQPGAIKIFNTYRNHWCGRYFQEAGLKVLPNINTGTGADLDYSFIGMPKHAPTIAIQLLSGSKSINDILEYRANLKRMMNTLLPDSLLVYVGRHWEEILDGVVPAGCRLTVIKSRQVRRMELYPTKKAKLGA
jgi:hypothetical protein